MTPGKRLFDLVIALVLAVVLLPVIAVLALAILLTDGRPVFYVSERMRTPDQPFNLWKFRTMRVVENDSGVSGGDKVDRITPMGRFLRRTRADELPQLWNVLRGDMSIVGPRPMMVSQKSLYPGTAYYAMRPGITGFWQISVRNESSFAERAGFDTDYLRALSFGTDIAVLLRTVRVVLNGTGC